MRKAKTLLNGALRLGGIGIYDCLIFGDDIGKMVWFYIGCLLVVFVIPFLVNKIVFSNQSYDATFLVDETDPTDIKFKLTFNIDPALLTKDKYMLVEIDHREGNIANNGGDNNG